MDSTPYKNYHGRIDFAAKNNSHTQAFIFLQEHCQNIGVSRPRVLEVGCSNGYFSEALRSHGAYVHAVEPFLTDAKDFDRVDEFFHGTIEEFCASSPVELMQKFDAVILGDVLEHLVDPRAVLVDVASFLKDDGVVIASVPNITHIGIRSMLEEGLWGYQKYGILDSTHVRFFSWHSLRKMFIEAGFGIERRYSVLLPEFRVFPSSASLQEFSFDMELNQHDHTFQHVIRASKKSFSNDAYSDSVPQNILVLSPNPNSSVSIIRLLKPLQEYARVHSGKVRAMRGAECTLECLRWADVVIAHREISIFTSDILKIARRLGVSVIYDTDDLLAKLPEWSLNRILGADKVLMDNAIATADRVTCTTPRLKEELLKSSESVYIIPNVHIPAKHTSAPEKRHYSNECTLVVASSDTVLVDFLIPPIRVLCKTFSALKVVAIGHIASQFKGISGRVATFPQCSEDTFSAILNSIDNGIGLIPLDDSLFSSCKSPIKYFHYAACGIISVASSVPPYTDCIDSGNNGILVDNQLDSWCIAVGKLVEDYQFRRRLLRKAIRTWQKSGSVKLAIKAWEQAFWGLPKPQEKVL